jgi:hypothetical protein
MLSPYNPESPCGNFIFGAINPMLETMGTKIFSSNPELLKSKKGEFRLID